LKILSATKKYALSRGHVGCLGEVATINLARGCAAGCTFCYARCVSGAPPPGSLLLYRDLADQLAHELDRRRRRPVPSFVLFSTASDPFLGGDPVLALTRATLELLVKRNIGVSLSTRGEIPDDVIDLLARHAPHVQVTVPLVSLSETYTRTWEPGTAPPRRRLFLVQRLLQAGVGAVQVRLEPIIPFANDATDSLREVASALVGLGLDSAMVGYMHLRPGVAEQVKRETTPDQSALVLGGFAPDPLQPLPGKFQHLPIKLRTTNLRRIQRIGRELGLHLSACHCQNPGIPARQCPLQPPELPRPVGEQITLLE